MTKFLDNVPSYLTHFRTAWNLSPIEDHTHCDSITSLLREDKIHRQSSEISSSKIEAFLAQRNHSTFSLKPSSSSGSQNYIRNNGSTYLQPSAPNDYSRQSQPAYHRNAGPTSSASTTSIGFFILSKFWIIRYKE